MKGITFDALPEWAQEEVDKQGLSHNLRWSPGPMPRANYIGHNGDGVEQARVWRPGG